MAARPAAVARPRTPAAVLGTLVLVLAVVVGAVALTSRQAAPPAVAEFAPQSVEQIKKALDAQAAAAGGSSPSPSPTPTAPPSAGTSASPGSTPGPTPGPSIVVPRVRQCVGTPPRQTEDPQSPPCVPYFDPKKDNGGATAPGVTRDQITVAVPTQFLEQTPLAALATFFNSRYEFYGRQLVLKAYTPSGCTDGVPAPDKQRADAVAVKEEFKAFASLAYCNASGADRAYYDALAAKQIISLSDGNLITGTEAAYRAHAPYEWNVQAGVETVLANTAEVLCNTLAGKKPRYAGGAQALPATRKFGLISTRATDGSSPDLTPLRTGLKACGVTLTEVQEEATSDPSRNGVNAIVTMANAGVTSLLCLCGVVDTRQKYMTAASGQGYQPEWLLTNYGNDDLDNAFSGGNAPPDQTGHILGLTFRNKLLPKQDMPWYWAVREGDPSQDPAGNIYFASNSRYEQLLLLASGMQLAGPHLTPASFQQGLQAAQFPNPGAGTTPFFQARVGFPGGRHVMSADATLWWYDPNRPGTIDPTVPGSVCYVERGLRHSLGQWVRRDPPFFTGACL